MERKDAMASFRSYSSGAVLNCQLEKSLYLVGEFMENVNCIPDLVSGEIRRIALKALADQEKPTFPP